MSIMGAGQWPGRRVAAMVLATAAVLAGVAAVGGSALAQPEPILEAIRGVLPDTTPYTVQKPAAWNGTLILDLDGAIDPARPLPGATRWLLAHGYAQGGTTRAACGYDFPHCVDNLVAVRQQFIERFGAPARTIVTGNSRGGFVARIAMERRPDLFVGAMVTSGGGAGSIAGFNSKLDGVWALKTLVDPSAPVPLDLVKDVDAENAALSALVAKATSTPAGRARFALAAAFEQFAPWTDRQKPEPAASDYEAQIDQMAAAFTFANPPIVRFGMRQVAGGNVLWNNGVDYRALLERSGRKDMVAAMYRKAGLDIEADLATLDKAPRVHADPKAVAKAEPLMTYTGRISGPIINVDNDDPVDPAPLKLAYLATLARAKSDHLFRLSWVRGAGHGGQTEIDRIAGFTVLVRRLDTGAWGDTSAAAMNALAARLATETTLPLGAPTFIELNPPKPLRTWDTANWGSYRP